MGNKINRAWIRIYSKILITLKLRGKTTGEIIWSRGLVLGGLSVIISLVYRIIRVDAVIPLSEYIITLSILYSFIYFSLSYYLQVRYAEVNIFKFLYVSIYASTVAVAVIMVADYIYFVVFENRTYFVEVMRNRILDNNPNVDSYSLQVRLDSYSLSMSTLYRFINWIVLFTAGAVLSAFISYFILLRKLKKEIVKIKKGRLLLSKSLKKPFSRRSKNLNRHKNRRRKIVKS